METIPTWAGGAHRDPDDDHDDNHDDYEDDPVCLQTLVFFLEIIIVITMRVRRGNQSHCKKSVVLFGIYFLFDI